MAVYAMALKKSEKSNGIVFKTNSSTLEEAKEYFRKLKQMSKEDFSELFIVSEIKNKQK
jgi:hypothetical protein